MGGKAGPANSKPASGWDADYTTAPAGYTYPLPDNYPDTELAPLLCAGVIGWRALARANLPPGGRLDA